MAYSSARGDVSLPDFRNFGVLIRALVLAEAINGLALLAHSASLADAWQRFGHWAPLFEATLLVVLAALAALQPVLARLPYRQGAAAVLLLSVVLALTVSGGVADWLALPAGDVGQVSVLAVALAAALLAYFNWRHRALSPALGEARLAALEARIGPHFLFNSINSVVALVREDPGLAERILLDLSDLFRALLGKERGLVSLDRELSLTRAYGEIEAVRLGGRLRLHWDVDGAPKGCLVPLLILQPLLENALRHGVEPEPRGGEVWVEAARRGSRLTLEVRNSLGPHAGGTGGNGMALANIGERLQLHFDAEARLQTFEREGQFVARVELPVRQGAGT